MLLPLVFMWDFVLGKEYLVYYDFRYQWIPWQKFVFDSFARGELPLWNPYLMLGFPQLAESQVGVFYWPKLLMYPIERIELGLAYVLCLHLSFAGIGTYRLLLSQRLSRASAFFGACSFSLSGYMFAQVTNYNIVLASAYLPWFVWLIERYLTTGRRLYLGFFSLALGLQLLVNHANTTFIVIVCLSVCFVVLAVSRRRVVRDLGWYAAAIAVGAAVGAAQLIPTLELRPLSERAEPLSFDYITNERYAIGFERLLSWFFPWFLGNSRAGRSMKFGYEETHHYAGAAVPALAALVALTWRGFLPRERRFMMAIGAASMLAFALSLGIKFPLVQPWSLLYELPGFNMFRIPARWGCVFTFGVSVLAAFGFEALLQRRVRVRTLAAALLALPVMAISAAALQEGARPILDAFMHPKPILDEATNVLEAALVAPLSKVNPVWLYACLATPMLVVYALLRLKLISVVHFGAIASALLVLDLFLVESPMNPRSHEAEYATRDVRKRLFDGERASCRVHPAGSRRELATLPMNLAAYYGVFSTSGDTTMELKSFMRLNEAFSRSEVLDYVGACYALHRRGRPKFRRGALPRAFFVTDVRSSELGDPLERFLALDGSELESVAFLAPQEFASLHAHFQPSQAAVEGRASIVRFENQHVELAVTSSGPGLLVMTDMMYPGWSATLDGRKTELYSPQGVFRGVFVPAGTHRVTFDYGPTSVYAGAALSLSSIAGLGIAFAYSRRKRGGGELGEARKGPRPKEQNPGSGTGPPCAR